MKPKKRQKLCYNCEGEVDLDVIVCPFCAADLREEKQGHHSSSFSPSAHSVKHLGSQPPPLYPSSQTSEEEDAPIHVQPPEPDQVSTEEGSEPKLTLAATALFTFGVQLFLMAVFLLIFQSHGSLILKWDARLWFLYLFASVPFLFFGFRALSKL